MSDPGEDDRSNVPERPPARPSGDDQGPPTIELRIDAVEAAVAAGLVRPASQPPEPAEPPPADATAAYELPDWADPPTGQIPRVLLEDPDNIDFTEPLVRKPTWRAQRDGWQGEEFDLSLLAAEPDEPATGEIAGTVLPEEAPFGFSALDEPAASEAVEAPEPDAEPWTDLFEQPPTERRRHAARRSARAPKEMAVAATVDGATTEAVAVHRPKRRRPKEPSTGRNGLIATVTGLGLGVLAVLCLLGGPAPTDGLIAFAGTIAAGEFFRALQRGGYRPATIVGLLAVPAVIIATYIDGVAAIAVVVAVCFVVTGGWFLRQKASEEPIVDAAVTLFVVIWVGVLGAFASLLLAPSIHPDGHGVALVFGVIACTVAHDIGSYVVGSKVGKHKIAPRISPGKTVEGLVGGTILDLVVAVTIVSRFAPFSIGTAALLGGVVAVAAPFGDLIESMVKRDLGIKDMGSILPAHGGVFDRVDAMLVAMPAAYLLFHIGNVV